MAKSSRSAYWFVRVDGPESFLTIKCTELSNCIDVKSILGTFHTGSKKEHPHCHFVIELLNDVQKQSFATVRIKKLFEIVKKSDYSVGIWDGKRDSGAASYLFHEENAPIIICKNFSEQDIDMAKQTNASIQKVVAINNERASTKLIDKALHEFTDGAFTRSDILLFMLQCIHKGDNYHPGMFKLKQYVEEVEIKLSKVDDLEGLAFRYERQMWRD